MVSISLVERYFGGIGVGWSVRVGRCSKKCCQVTEEASRGKWNGELGCKKSKDGEYLGRQAGFR